MVLDDLVSTAANVAATSSRNEKIDLLAQALRQTSPGEIEAAVGFLVGWPRQGRIGVGGATAYGLDVAPAPEPTLTVRDVDDAIERVRAITGTGSVQARAEILTDLLARATSDEQVFIRRIFTGEMRHGALEGVVAAAVAKAAGVPATVVRRATMLSGDLCATARIALTEGRDGLERIGLTVLRPVLPMLASTAETVQDALTFDGPASVEWKLDGIRIQAHRDGDEVRVFSRNGNDLTDRLPGVVTVVHGLPVRAVVLDGEAIGLDESERPYAFQDTMSGTGRRTEAFGAVPFFFDVLHLDGEDLLDLPLVERLDALERVAGHRRIRSTVTEDAAEAQRFLDSALAAGHEGIMVKDLSSPYQAGRRGKAWRKVKPAKTFDLVVLAAEWGHGRRRGWLSNLHLGALDDNGTPVMVGKTFKGMTDALLAWQTEKLQSIKEREEGITVWVRPDLVVEIELEGVQTSTRYPGGIALRFARLLRYRDDKTAADADTLESLRALQP
ncbi:MAG TPA: ATP-dependent DNA ligase [Actinomycetota bacterium]|nr:ATP-dependent DNA ligase [Actinomycetota bacterium]